MATLTEALKKFGKVGRPIFDKKIYWFRTNYGDVCTATDNDPPFIQVQYNITIRDALAEDWEEYIEPVKDEEILVKRSVAEKVLRAAYWQGKGPVPLDSNYYPDSLILRDCLKQLGFKNKETE